MCLLTQCWLFKTKLDLFTGFLLKQIRLLRCSWRGIFLKIIEHNISISLHGWKARHASISLCCDTNIIESSAIVKKYGIWTVIGCTNHFKPSHVKAIKIAIRGRSLALLLVTTIITFKNSIWAPVRGKKINQNTSKQFLLHGNSTGYRKF